jgi:hypothetical protein
MVVSGPRHQRPTIDAINVLEAPWTRGDRSVMITWTEKAPEELRLRGAEVVAAYETCFSKKPRGYRKALRETERPNEITFGFERKIAETPTDTIEGMRAKIQCAQLWGYRHTAYSGEGDVLMCL